MHLKQVSAPARKKRRFSGFFKFKILLGDFELLAIVMRHKIGPKSIKFLHKRKNFQTR
jgi:hypothetical protein